MPKVPELYIALKDISVAAYSQYQQLRTQNLIPTRAREHWIRDPNGFFVRTPETSDVNPFSHEELRSKVISDNEFQCVKSVFAAHPILKKHMNAMIGTSLGTYRFTVETILFSFLMDLFEQAANFNTRIFNQCYSRLESDILANTITKEFWTILQGFHSDILPLKFCENIEMRSISEEEKIELLKIGFSFGRRIYAGAFEDDILHALVIRATVAKLFDPTDNPSYADTLFDRDQTRYILSALHLCSGGYLHVLGTLTKSDSFFSTGTGYQIFSPKPIHPSNYLKIPRENVDQLTRVYAAVHQYAQQENTDHGNWVISRFVESANRNLARDRIIDLMTILESMLVSGEKGIGQKLAERSAKLLGVSEESEQEIKRSMMHYYKIRSKLLHGEDIRPFLNEKDDLAQISRRLEEYTRRIIIIWLENQLSSE